MESRLPRMLAFALVSKEVYLLATLIVASDQITGLQLSTLFLLLGIYRKVA